VLSSKSRSARLILKLTGAKFLCSQIPPGWLGSRVVSVLDSGAEGPGSNHSRDAVG